MTFCHIQLRKIDESESTVIYSAFSPDFNDKFCDERMADIVVNKILKTYDFIPGEKWVSSKTIPPMVYSLPEESRDELIETKYNGHGNGAWTMRIHHWITQIIQEGDFPNIYPI